MNDKVNLDERMNSKQAKRLPWGTLSGKPRTASSLCSLNAVLRNISLLKQKREEEFEKVIVSVASGDTFPTSIRFTIQRWTGWSRGAALQVSLRQWRTTIGHAKYISDCGNSATWELLPKQGTERRSSHDRKQWVGVRDAHICTNLFHGVATGNCRYPGVKEGVRTYPHLFAYTQTFTFAGWFDGRYEELGGIVKAPRTCKLYTTLHKGSSARCHWIRD